MKKKKSRRTVSRMKEAPQRDVPVFCIPRTAQSKKHNIPGNQQMPNQGVDLTIIKVEVESDDEWMTGDTPCKMEEEIPADVTAAQLMRGRRSAFVFSRFLSLMGGSLSCVVLPWALENPITDHLIQHYSGENIITVNIQPGPDSNRSIMCDLTKLQRSCTRVKPHVTCIDVYGR
ncbi:unnamed protein product, partial [Ranitomeya imitator]